MKTLFFGAAFVLVALFQYNNQNTETIEAVYDGHEEYGYNFIAKHPDTNEEYTMTFQKVNEAVLKDFNLNSQDLIGLKFKVTFKTEIIVTKDEDNYEDENEVNTIMKLEKL